MGSCLPARALSEEALVANTPAAREALLAAGTDGYLVQALPALVKARPEQLAPGSPALSLALHAARGEAESGQVLVTPLREGLRQVNAQAQLRGPDGAALAAELRLLGTVPVAHPTAVSFGVAGDYPDPLRPLRPFDVEVGKSQSLWLTVRVPPDAVPGEYTGAVTVAPSGREPAALPLTVTVYPVDLPALSFLKTVILLYDGIPFYGERWPEAYRFMNEELLRSRFSQMWLGGKWDGVFHRGDDGLWTATWDEFDADVTGWLARGRTTFLVPHDSVFKATLGIPDDAANQDEAARKLALLDAHLVARGWGERFYIYAFDEPAPDRVGAIARFCAFIRQHAPHLPVLMTAPHGTMLGTGNVWIPHIHELARPGYIGGMLRRVTAGEQFWTYTCMGTRWIKTPDSWRIDWYGTSHRALGWLLFQQGCQGYLYWNGSYWHTGSGTERRRFDPLHDPAIINDTNYPNGHCNGDGFLFYPDPEGKDLPYSSMRLEITRDAFEDYDLLTLLERQIVAIRSDPARLALCEPARLEAALAALATYPLVRAVDDFEKDAAAYDAAHLAVLRALAGLGR
jgi:hypothetical protein